MLGAPSLSILGHSAVVYGDQMTFAVYIKLSSTFNSFANKILGQYNNQLLFNSLIYDVVGEDHVLEKVKKDDVFLSI